MPRTPAAARARILAVADELFYRDGIRATGVDTIVEQSAVAKTTLYRYFPSKDDLVVAYLEKRNRQFWQLYDEAVNRYPGQPRQQLVAIFAWLDELLSQPESCGCPFLLVASEFPDPHYPGHQVAIAHKHMLRDRLAALAREASIDKPEALSIAWMLAIDGAFAQRRLFQQHEQGTLATAAAQLLVGFEIQSEIQSIESAQR
jgi:AcrR family transcriptional regulator